jgi:hypothetical protein
VTGSSYKGVVDRRWLTLVFYSVVSGYLSMGATDPYFSGAKALYFGNSRINNRQKPITYFLPPTPRLLPPSLFLIQRFLVVGAYHGKTPSESNAA